MYTGAMVNSQGPIMIYNYGCAVDSGQISAMVGDDNTQYEMIMKISDIVGDSLRFLKTCFLIRKFCHRGVRL
jgi:hypothetical protein